MELLLSLGYLRSLKIHGKNGVDYSNNLKNIHSHCGAGVLSTTNWELGYRITQIHNELFSILSIANKLKRLQTGRIKSKGSFFYCCFQTVRCHQQNRMSKVLNLRFEQRHNNREYDSKNWSNFQIEAYCCLQKYLKKVNKDCKMKLNLTNRRRT
jgi:hypothetical protein